MPCGRSLDSGQALPERRRNGYLLPFRPASGPLAGRYYHKTASLSPLPSVGGAPGGGSAPPSGEGRSKCMMSVASKWPLAPGQAPIPTAHYREGTPIVKVWLVCVPVLPLGGAAFAGPPRLRYGYGCKQCAAHAPPT